MKAGLLAGRVAAGAWTPAELDLKFWYDGVDSPYTSGVLCLEDLSGNDMDMALASGTVTAGGETLNGIDTLHFSTFAHFNPKSGHAGASASAWKFLHYNAVTTILAVVKFYNTTNPDTFLTLLGTNGTSTSSRGTAIWYEDTNPINNQLSLSITAASGGSFVAKFDDDNFVAPNGYRLVLVTLDPGNGTAGSRIRNVRVNDAVSANGTTGTLSESSSDPSSAMALGAANTSGVGELLGGIAEIFAFVGSDSGEITAAFTYLNDKYNLGLTP